jgi:hypothetical protein
MLHLLDVQLSSSLEDTTYTGLLDHEDQKFKAIEEVQFSEAPHSPATIEADASKLLRTTSTHLALSAVPMTAIPHTYSSIATCGLHLCLTKLTSRHRRFHKASRAVARSTQTVTDHSPHAVWSPHHASRGAKCQDKARAGALRQV